MPRKKGNGPGWGGPAKGAGGTAPFQERVPFAPGNKKAAGYHDMSKSQRAETLKEHLFQLATTAEREETQVRAAEAWLNRHEGLPIARTVNLDPADLSMLDDGTLAAIALGTDNRKIN